MNLRLCKETSRTAMMLALLLATNAFQARSQTSAKIRHWSDPLIVIPDFTLQLTHAPSTSLCMGQTDDLSPQQEENETLGLLEAASRATDVASSVTVPDDEGEGKASTGTVNERLQAELQAATDKERYGAKSSWGKKMGLGSGSNIFGGRIKTDDERAAAIAEARDLNGVNPVVTLLASGVALAGAFGLWQVTQILASFFATHPVTSDVYFVERSAGVVRNIVMGLFALASGFFGVTGLGIMALGVRVAYGVATGELDPTPLPPAKKGSANDVSMDDLPNVWDLMMNKKPGRRASK